MRPPKQIRPSSTMLALLKAGIRLDFRHAFIERVRVDNMLQIAVGIQQRITVETYDFSNAGLMLALAHVEQLKLTAPEMPSPVFAAEREALMKTIEQQTMQHAVSSGELIALVQLAAAASSVGITALELIHTGITENMLRNHPDLAAVYRSVMRSRPPEKEPVN